MKKLKVFTDLFEEPLVGRFMKENEMTFTIRTEEGEVTSIPWGHVEMITRCDDD